jgi:hypothetical protein
VRSILALDMQRTDAIERTNIPMRVLLSLIFVCVSGSFAFASDPITDSQLPQDAPLLAASLTPPPIEVVHMPADFEAPSRGTALPILYGSLALLQSYDAVTTLRGVGGGGVEANPMMAGASRNPAAMWAVKVGVTTASIVAAERLWRQHHRGQAIAVMAIANGVMAGVALHNGAAMKGVR